VIAATDDGVTFRVKDCRRSGRERYRSMTLPPGEFIRRFLLHVLPNGFHRIRHYGLLAGAARRANLARARDLLADPEPEPAGETGSSARPHYRPPCSCSGQMIIVETFPRGHRSRAPPASSPGPRAAAP
jgi:Putative transposase